MKEEELRKEGGPKHGHLNDQLHLNIEALAPAAECYAKLANALKEVHPYLLPVSIFLRIGSRCCCSIRILSYATNYTYC